MRKFHHALSSSAYYITQCKLYALNDITAKLDFGMQPLFVEIIMRGKGMAI